MHQGSRRQKPHARWRAARRVENAHLRTAPLAARVQPGEAQRSGACAQMDQLIETTLCCSAIRCRRHHAPPRTVHAVSRGDSCAVHAGARVSTPSEACPSGSGALLPAHPRGAPAASAGERSGLRRCRASICSGFFPALLVQAPPSILPSAMRRTPPAPPPTVTRPPPPASVVTATIVAGACSVGET